MHRLPNYLRANRKRWALTQAELAVLLGLESQAIISLYEADAKHISAEVLLKTEILFAIPSRDLFPKAFSEIEGAIMNRAKALYARLEQRTDIPSAVKLRLLKDMIHRIEAGPPHV